MKEVVVARERMIRVWVMGVAIVARTAAAYHQDVELGRDVECGRPRVEFGNKRKVQVDEKMVKFSS